MEKMLKKWLKDLKVNESTISAILGGLVLVVVGVLIYNYFTKVGKNQSELAGGQFPTEQIQTDLPTTHTVQAKEHLWQIAEKYYGSGYNWVDIAAANKLANPNLIEVGQKLEIPKVAVKGQVKTEETIMTATATPNAISGSTYTVQKGDTLWSIAVRTYQDGYKWPEIVKTNADKIANPDRIEVGQVLTLPR